ncbi:hypothetical protein ACES2I_04175 [Bdellovibrio bacteriovorus]|uniref:hypothetical protein n=1 Tax=Bdellovibrio bacteriovorus TaxID=959 RepID=UPI0035A723F8
MKYLVVFGLLMMSTLPAQAGKHCYYTETACDDFGNHYMCSAGNGWAGDRQFCSPEDVSSKNVTRSLKARDYLKECIEECVSAGGAPSTCHHRCW